MNLPTISSEKKILVVFFALLLISVSSYIYFSIYSPKVLKEVPEVKGAVAAENDVLPYPIGATRISYDDTVRGKQITFQVNRSPQEVQQFYKNVLLPQEWKIVSESESLQVIKIKYSKERKNIDITSASQEDIKSTVLSIDIY